MTSVLSPLDPMVLDHIAAWDLHALLQELPGPPALQGLVGTLPPAFEGLDATALLHLWGVADTAHMHQFSVRARPWRCTIFGSICTLTISRFGSYCKLVAPPAPDRSTDPWEVMNASPTKIITDLYMVSRVGSDLLDLLAHQHSTPAGSRPDFTEALSHHLDQMSQYARTLVQDRHDLLPLPSPTTNTLYWQQPLNTEWVQMLGLEQPLPKALKTAYLFDPANGVPLMGTAPGDSTEACLRLWWEVVSLASYHPIGTPVGVAIYNPEHALFLDPTPCGQGVLTTAWYRASALHEIQRATFSMSVLLSRLLQDG